MHINDDKKDDLLSSIPCVTSSVYILLMTSKSIIHRITIETRAREKLFLTHRCHFYSWMVVQEDTFHSGLLHLNFENHTVYPKKYAHGFCFDVLCCGYTLTDFPISIRLTSLALWQSNDCSSASKAILMNMDKYFIWIHYERLHNHNKAMHNKTVCIFLGIYCMMVHHWWRIPKNMDNSQRNIL